MIEEKKERIPYLEMRRIWINSEIFSSLGHVDRNRLVKELFLENGWDIDEYSLFSSVLFYRS